MAVEYIEVYPTCDIHLLLDGPEGSHTTYQLQVRYFDNLDNNLPGDDDKTKYTDNNPDIATVSDTGLITPKAVGETFCRIRHTDDSVDPKIVSEIVVRIRVHETMDAFWIGNNQVTLFKDEDNYVLTVYGFFSDGTIGDVSSHPYLTFSSTNPNKVEVNNNTDKGRLKGKAVTGSNPVKIKVAYNGDPEEVDAFVVPGFLKTRPILKCIHGTGNVDERRNILLLSEGFTEAEKSLFIRIATLLKDRLFTSNLNSPYNILENKFNFWIAFDSSPEQGISAGDFILKNGLPVASVDDRLIKPDNSDNYSLRKLILHVGLPDRYYPSTIPTNPDEAKAAWALIGTSPGFKIDKVEDKVLDAWLLLREYHLLQAKDSLFGFMNGLRYGDRFSKRVINPDGTPENVMHWYEPPAFSHGLRADGRRMHKNWKSLLDPYLDSLRPVKGKNAKVRLVWMPGGKDRNLIAFLVNSAYSGGSHLSSTGAKVSVRQNTSYTELSLDFLKGDHTVPEIGVPPFLPYLMGSSVDEIVCVLAHELAHAFDLGDEYEGGDYGGTHDVLRENDKAARKKIEECSNLIHHYTIQKTSGDVSGIDMDRVKWKLWHRISRCSVLTKDATALSGNRLRIGVNPAERSKWEFAMLVENADVFLRSRNINADVIAQPPEDPEDPPDPKKRWFLEGPLKIEEVQTDGTVILSGSSFDVFKKGDILYQPQTEGGKPLTVFHPEVLFWLEAVPEPFEKKYDDSEANDGAGYPPSYVTDSSFKPLNEAFVVGVYEGGGTYNTRVYRPSGMCKNRVQQRTKVKEKPITIDETGEVVVGTEREDKRFMPFCYVCRYSIVNTVDPTQLDGLVYPE